MEFKLYRPIQASVVLLRQFWAGSLAIIRARGSTAKSYPSSTTTTHRTPQLMRLSALQTRARSLLTIYQRMATLFMESLSQLVYPMQVSSLIILGRRFHQKLLRNTLCDSGRIFEVEAIHPTSPPRARLSNAGELSSTLVTQLHLDQKVQSIHFLRCSYPTMLIVNSAILPIGPRHLDSVILSGDPSSMLTQHTSLGNFFYLLAR
jgi:hypothetical protein